MEISIFFSEDLETKTDDTFLSNQFTISGFATPFRFDQIRKGGGIIVYLMH